MFELQVRRSDSLCGMPSHMMGPFIQASQNGQSHVFLLLFATLSDTISFSFYRSAMVYAQCVAHVVEPIAQKTASTPMAKIDRVPRC
jgi:hypothetical protein